VLRLQLDGIGLGSDRHCATTEVFSPLWFGRCFYLPVWLFLPQSFRSFTGRRGEPQSEADENDRKQREITGPCD